MDKQTQCVDLRGVGNKERKRDTEIYVPFKLMAVEGRERERERERENCCCNFVRLREGVGEIGKERERENDKIYKR